MNWRRLAWFRRDVHWHGRWFKRGCETPIERALLTNAQRGRVVIPGPP